MTDEPPSRATGTLAGLVDRLLSYMDAPWKAFVVVVLVVLSGVGWVLYEKRDLLLEEWLTPDTPELRTKLIPGALERLTTETSADLVQIWAVDLSANSQTFIGARTHDGERPVIPSPRRLPIIDRKSDIGKLIEVLEGHPVCVDIDMTGTPVARRLRERGLKRGCAIPIPPSSESFLGIIYLVWATAVDASEENVAVSVARDVAQTLATH